jgi:5'-nucleotidase
MGITEPNPFGGESVAFRQPRDTTSQPTAPDIRLLHYNDVYHLDPSSAEPQGGVARFVSAYQQYRDDKRFNGQPELINLFSGDVFNPSLESSITKGKLPVQAHV